MFVLCSSNLTFAGITIKIKITIKKVRFANAGVWLLTRRFGCLVALYWGKVVRLASILDQGRIYDSRFRIVEVGSGLDFVRYLGIGK